MLSVVTTVYKSEDYLLEFISEIKSALDELSCHEFEMIFVLDGITDESKDLLLQQQQHLPQIKILELSRNFGHHQAIFAGLQVASGERIFLIDCDLEVSPLVLVEFMKMLQDSGADVVFGVQHQRKGDFVERKLGEVFWKTFNYLSDTKIPLNTVTERLMTRSYLDALLSMGDRNVFFAGMMHWIGFNQLPCTVFKVQRSGVSTYTFRKRKELLIEAITSFSDKPLRLLFRIGVIILVASLIFSIGLITNKILYPEAVLLGYASVIVVMLFGIGSTLSALGLVGLYLSKVFNQVKNRPLYWVKNVY